MKLAVVGGGVFGLSAAAAMARRGHRVRLFEAERIPAAKAASTDLSKAIRASYGASCTLYAPAAGEAREAWRRLEHETGRRILHETGGLHLVRDWARATFERTSFEWLAANGWPVRRVDAAEAARLVPWIRSDDLPGGYVDLWAGWLDPMQALPALAEAAVRHGVELREGSAIPTGAGIPGASSLDADAVLVCGGAWIAKLLPEMRSFVRTTAQHEAFFRPAAPTPESWRAAPFWSFDLAVDGWYGFPPHASGIVKIARHVPDREADPDGDRAPDPAQAAQVRAFVRARAPGLAEAPDEGRTCLYTMSPDGHFVFDAAPGRPGVFLAGCGSGHAFKFGPVLGRWSADLLEGRPVPAAFRLAGRTPSRVV